MMKIIVKMYYSATMHHTSDYTRQPGPTRDWWAAFKRLLDKELPEDAEGREPRGMPTDRDECAQWVWWKLKKWLLTVAERFFSHHGIPNIVDKKDKEAVAAAELWCEPACADCGGRKRDVTPPAPGLHISRPASWRR